MPDDPMISSTPGALGNVYADSAKRQLYCLAECPPIGRIRLGIHSDAFGIDVDSSENDDGRAVLEMKHTFLRSKAEEATRSLHKLSAQWPMLWPLIHDSLVQVRRDYGRSAAITNTNCSLVLAPPGPGDEYWWCELELDEWDGFYAVRFNVCGDIAEACASF